MKGIYLVFCLMTIGLIACVKENTPTVPLNNNVDTTVAMPLSEGIFMNGPYGTVSGMAILYKQDGSSILALRNMQISNGPQLHVYLSKELQPVNFVDLGSLQSTNGNQLYQIPGGTDLSQYPYALVHCKKYNHLFGGAKLQ